MSIRNKLGVAPPKKHVPTVKEAVATTSSIKRVRKSNERFATQIVEQKQTDAENTFKEELDRIANEAAYKRQEEDLILEYERLKTTHKRGWNILRKN